MIQGRSVPFLLGAFLAGILVGWAGATLRRHPEAPLPRPSPSVPPLEREGATAEKAPVASPAPPPQRPIEAPPASVAERSKDVSSASTEWEQKVRSVDRIKDLLDLKIPPGDRSDALRVLMNRARDLLKHEDAQRILLAELPSFSIGEMVRLWDVFWTVDRNSVAGFAPYGSPFARELSRTLAELVSAQSSLELRMIAASMVVQDTRSLNDAELAHLRGLLLADPEPSMRRFADLLPLR
jgi:hypothetical protein